MSNHFELATDGSDFGKTQRSLATERPGGASSYGRLRSSARQTNRPKTVQRLRQATGRSNSVVSSILGNMYTPSTQASFSQRLGTEGGTRRSRSSRNSQSAQSTRSYKSNDQSQRTYQSNDQSQRTYQSNDQSNTNGGCVDAQDIPTTAEVVLAKKQLKMESMIRKLLVQQQQADATIAELSDSLSRLGPSETQELGASHGSRKGSSGSQQFGQPAMGPQHRYSPWHQLREDQDISKCLRAPVSSRSCSSLGSKHTDSTNVHSLINPSGFSQTRQSKRITKSPNHNPPNIKASANWRQESKHMDSGDPNLVSWGSTGERQDWESSSERWATTGGDAQATIARNTKSNHAKSRARPASSCSGSRRNERNMQSQANKFEDAGLNQATYEQLAQYNSEFEARPPRDSELIPH